MSDEGLHPVLQQQLDECGVRRDEVPSLEQWQQFVDGVDEHLSETAEGMLILDHNFDNMIRHAVDGFLIHDTAGDIIDANQAACEMLGYSREELLSLHVADFELELDPGAIWDDMAVDEVFTVEGTHLRKDGSTYPVETRVGAFIVDGQKVILALCRDITERKQAQEELQALNAQLEQARDEAVRANRTKSAFLANMSHELRTPLNAVIGYSEFLIEEMEADGDEHLADLEKILTAGHHLLSLINDILDLSKIEAGKVELDIEECELRTILAEIESTAAPLAADNDNELIVETEINDVTMKTDVTKLRQVLFNLLSNAAKFTSDGTIQLAVREHRAGESLRFTVRDTGIGMSEEELGKVFSAFQQADTSTTREYGGTGLGLAISKQYTEMMGGAIDVDSQVGEGTTFNVMVPVDCRTSRESTAGGAGRRVAETINTNPEDDGEALVLVIEDDPASRELLERMLTDEGYQVVTADDGARGLELARSLEPVAITLDLLMPEMSGWQVLSRIRRDDALSDIPVVLISMLDERKRGIALGADDFLVKPVDRAQLTRLIADYGGSGQQRRCLVVEDDEATRELIGRIVECEGWAVSFARDGRQGLKRATEVDPDLVILDLMMPDVDGFGFLSRFRRDNRFDDVPVIVCTAKELTAGEVEQLDEGAATVVKKSGWGAGEVLAEVRRSLQSVS